jgi:outer membrane protein OmpA-like peptidoglycan-associated protein
MRWAWPLALLAAGLLLPGEARASSCAWGPFYVEFESGQGRLPAKGRPVLDYIVAVAALRPGEDDCGTVERIVVQGHSDRVGPARRNLALSRHRAEAVRAYLVAHGVREDMLTTEALGEIDPPVETPDGVEEAENRRVVIIFAPRSAA